MEVNLRIVNNVGGGEGSVCVWGGGGGEGRDGFN